MQASSPTNPTRHRRKVPILTLIALSALAAALQTLAPATATAMDDQGGAGECRSFAGAPPGAGWNGTEFCTLTDGSAGGGGGATGGDGSGGGTVGNEVIVILDPYSPPKPTNPLCKSARLCLPGQSGGGRPLGIDRDGPSRGGPRGGGTGPGGKGESPTKLTKEECLKRERAIGIWKAPKNWDSLMRSLAGLRRQLSSLHTQLGELPASDSQADEDEKFTLLGMTHFVRDQIASLELGVKAATDARNAWRDKLEAWKKICVPVLDVK